MAGIYIHIPFCRQKCHYCNFYSVASEKNKTSFLEALKKEIELQKHYLGNEIIETIYFGGGTPSILTADEINHLFQKIQTNFSVSDNAEITFEANPDDLTRSYLKALKKTRVNRLSIGVQSFFENDLKYLNRVHSANQAYNSVKNAQEAGFQNMSIDLIYGIPTLSETNWYKNLEVFFKLNIPHLSAYALTVEPKTAMEVLIRKQEILPVEEERILDHFKILLEQMKQNGYIHYEISNFCKESFYSLHNKNYWFRKNYLGLGPSAHSFNGDLRQWNVSNIEKYISLVISGSLPKEIEELSINQKYNEYILTSLRTIWGCDGNYILKQFGVSHLGDFKRDIEKYIIDNKVYVENHQYYLTDSGKLFADGIAADLFL
ncbi:MAG: radical SAM family heme chaperone HemW [Bacteroidales bacterium]|nr:radical SAM family heme chaperone HemW [Bacteroidales bacterium]